MNSFSGVALHLVDFSSSVALKMGIWVFLYFSVCLAGCHALNMCREKKSYCQHKHGFGGKEFLQARVNNIRCTLRMGQMGWFSPFSLSFPACGPVEVKA